MQTLRVVTKVTKKIDDDNSEPVGNENVKVTGGIKPRLVVTREDVPSTFEELREALGNNPDNESAFISTVYEDYSLAAIQQLKLEFAKVLNPADSVVNSMLGKMASAIRNFTPISLVTAGERASEKSKKFDTVRDLLEQEFDSPEAKLEAIRAAMLRAG